MEKITKLIKKMLPVGLLGKVLPFYHNVWAYCSAIYYRHPSREIKVIGVTGTKGKSSTVEIISAILEKVGYKTALSNTIRFKIGDKTEENLYKMSMPGRGFMQRFLRQAVNVGCDYAIVEMTSQGSITYRHLYIDLDAFVFTNLSPEHIDAHGSYENYVEAKVDIGRQLIRSSKKDRVMIVNNDDQESHRFTALAEQNSIESVGSNDIKVIKYSLKQVEPYEVNKIGVNFVYHDRPVSSPLSGLFNIYNLLAGATVASAFGVSDEIIVRALEKFSQIPGRVQYIEAGQNFKVIVDYAHTPDSLEKLYKVFRPNPKIQRSNKLIAVLGGTGGGRDNWKRAEMGRLADLYCDQIILTDEDPYDEDPRKIVDDVARGIKNKKPEIIMDRRLAIHRAIESAEKDDVILITGKGTDPYIMGPNGTKVPWSDAQIAKEELTTSTVKS